MAWSGGKIAELSGLAEGDTDETRGAYFSVVDDGPNVVLVSCNRCGALVGNFTATDGTAVDNYRAYREHFAEHGVRLIASVTGCRPS